MHSLHLICFSDLQTLWNSGISLWRTILHEQNGSHYYGLTIGNFNQLLLCTRTPG